MPRGFVQLTDDVLVAWSTVVDAPTSAPLVPALVRAELSVEQRRRLDERGHTFSYDCDASEFVAFNRAGPRELCLTHAALVRLVVEGCRTESGTVDESRFDVGDVEPYTTTHAVAVGHELHGRVFWRPFDPSDPPASLAEVDPQGEVEAAAG